jgi:hypothetical protein
VSASDWGWLNVLGFAVVVIGLGVLVRRSLPRYDDTRPEDDR